MKKLIALFILVVILVVAGSRTAKGNNSDVDINANYALLMAESMANGNYNQARYYETLRNQKKALLGIQDNITFDNLLLLAKIVHAEAGSDWLTEEHRQLVASVVINRVNSPEFPNTIHNVIYQRGQYAPAGTKYFNNLKPSRKCVFSALKVLASGSVAPSNVVFQANFKQGSGVYKSIYDRRLGTTYFCYSSNRNLYK